RRFRGSIAQRLISLSTLHNGGCLPSCKTRFRLLARLFRAGLVTRRVPAKGFTVVTILLSRASWRDVGSSFRARMMNCRVGKGRPAGSIELGFPLPPLKFR